MKSQRITKAQTRALQNRMEELSSAALLVPPHPDPGRVEFVRAVSVPFDADAPVFPPVAPVEAVPVDLNGSEELSDAAEQVDEQDSVVDSLTETVAPAEAEDSAAPALANSDEQPLGGSRVKHLENVAPVSLTWDFNSEISSSDEVIISLKSVSKLFGDKVALTELSFDVRAGGFYGLLGPNGAGKTTTLSLLSGLLQPDGGQIELFGHGADSEACSLRSNVGVLPDRLYTFDKLTGRQLLHYNGVVRGMSGPALKNRIDELADAFNISADLTRAVSDYSGGMTKKILLAAAVIHSPRLLVLDEPFEGLDPSSVETFLAILKSYVSSGGTVFFSSHGMELVEEICDHLIVIADGRVVADGPIASVKQDSSLAERFLKLTDSSVDGEILSWLQTFSD